MSCFVAPGNRTSHQSIPQNLNISFVKIFYMKIPTKITALTNWSWQIGLDKLVLTNRSWRIGFPFAAIAAFWDCILPLAAIATCDWDWDCRLRLWLLISTKFPSNLLDFWPEPHQNTYVALWHKKVYFYHFHWDLSNSCFSESSSLRPSWGSPQRSVFEVLEISPFWHHCYRLHAIFCVTGIFRISGFFWYQPSSTAFLRVNWYWRTKFLHQDLHHMHGFTMFQPAILYGFSTSEFVLEN